MKRLAGRVVSSSEISHSNFYANEIARRDLRSTFSIECEFQIKIGATNRERSAVPRRNRSTLIQDNNDVVPTQHDLNMALPRIRRVSLLNKFACRASMMHVSSGV